MQHQIYEYVRAAGTAIPEQAILAFARCQERDAPQASVVAVLEQFKQAGLLMCTDDAGDGLRWWSLSSQTATAPVETTRAPSPPERVKSIWSRPVAPQHEPEQHKQHEPRSTHRVVAHTADREIEDAIFEYLEDGDKYERSTTEFVEHLSGLFGETMTRDAVVPVLRDLGTRNLLKSVQPDAHAPYVWYLPYKTRPEHLARDLIDMLQGTSKTSGMSTRDIVDELRVRTHRRLLYTDVQGALISLGKGRKKIDSYKVDSDRYSYWYLLK